jgi:hypothetical protein
VDGAEILDMETARPMTLEEFLAWEELQVEKHEFSCGTILDFAAGTNRHHVMVTTRA